MDALQPAEREAQARQIANSQGPMGSANGANTNRFETTPKVPMCYAESIASTVISKNKDQIETANNNVVRNLNTYIDGIQGELDGLSAVLRVVKN